MPSGVVNGTGAAPDTNTAKDVYSRLSYKFGGFGVTGSDDERGELPQAESWLDNSVRLGTSSYFGTGGLAGVEDPFWRVGGDVDVFVGALNLSAVAFRGRDELQHVPTRFTAASVEANYVVKPWVVAIFRYDSASQEGRREIRRLVPGVALAIRANVRVVAEWEAFLRTSFDGGREAGGESRARFRLDLAF